MKITCPHCDQHIEIDGESAEMLKELTSFECPTCTGAVPVPKTDPNGAGVNETVDEEAGPAARQECRASLDRLREPKEGGHSCPPHDALPSGASVAHPLVAAVGRMNRTMRILGVLALLTIGGLVIFLATRKQGDTYETTRKIRDEIIHNDFFTRLIAGGSTSEEELKKVHAFVPYGSGYIGLSEDGWNWSEAQLLAKRAAAEVADMALLPTDSRKAFGALLAEQFPSSIGEVAWIRDNGDPMLIDSPDLLKTSALDRPRRVFLSWPNTGDWQNHGWSWTIPAKFDEVTPFSEWGLAAVRVDSQWGIIDESGEFLQPVHFDLVETFSDQGCARVRVGETWGLVNRKGELVAKPEWEEVQDQINGFTPVRKDGKWGYLDATGTLAIACEWDDAWRFSPEGFAVVTREGKRGFINAEGKVIVAPQWDGAINFSKEGFGMVRQGNGWAVIDTAGRSLTRPILELAWRDRRWDLGFLPHYHGATAQDGSSILDERQDRYLAFVHPERRFSESLALVDTETGSGFVDTFGEWAISPTEYFCRDFHEGFAPASKDGKWGFIDRTGQLVILPEWDEVTDFFEGVARVKRGELWGLIAKDGKLITDPIWDEVREFREGFLAVKRGDLWGFLDRSGKIVAQPMWKMAGDFSEGFASVQIEPSAEQLAKIPSYIKNYAFWSFLDTGGKPAFEGKVWFNSVYGTPRPPSFKNGSYLGQVTEGEIWHYVRIDVQGRILPYAEVGDPEVITPGLSLKDEPRGLYLDRHERTKESAVLRDATQDLVMQGVNRSSDLLADLIPHAPPPKYGLIDMAGKVIVPPTWDETKILSPDWIWFRLGDKCGLADKTGRIHIAPTWDSLKILEVDSGRLGEDGKSVLIGSWNRGGESILSPWIEAYREGSGGIVILQMNGTPAIPETMAGASYVDFYDRDRIVIKEPDPQGGFLLSLYEPASGKRRSFPAAAKLRWNWNTASLGFIWLQNKETLRWHLIGANGEDYGHSQPELEKPEGWGFIEGRGRLHNEGGWFHISTDGKPISAETWEEAHDFAEGRAAVKRGGKWGYIGLDGTLITEIAYEEANDFSRGLAAVKVEGRWGFIDPTGDLVIAAVWDEVTSPESEAVPGFYRWFGEPGADDPPGEPPFLDIAQVKINGAAALIGREGKLIIDPRLSKVQREGDAYLDGDNPMIVMRWGDGVGLEKREWYAWSDLAWLENDEPFQISPAFRWQVREQDYEKARELAKQTAAIWDEVRGSGAENRGARIRQFWKTDGLGQNLDQANWVLINQMGKPLSEGNWIRPKVNRTSDPFSGGLIHARGQNDKYGLIRKDGTTIMEPRFDNINWVAPKIAAVWNRDDGGLITAEGEWLFQDNETARIARFVRPTDSQFRHGLAVIEDVPQWGYARLNRTAPTQEKP